MKKLLIVVDYQNDFVDGALGFKAAKELEPIILDVIHKYEKNKDEIIFTLDTHDHNYLDTIEGKNLPIPHCIAGTKGHQIYGKIEPYSRKYLNIEKETFGAKQLTEYLSQHEYDEIELIGVVTNICVISNAILCKTMLPHARIIVNAKACASYDPDLEQKSLDILQNLHIEVIR